MDGTAEERKIDGREIIFGGKISGGNYLPFA